MRKILIVLTVIMLAGTLAAQDERGKTLSVEPGGLLELELKSGGSIQITGWDQNEVQVDISWSGCDPEDYHTEIEPTKEGVSVYCKSKRRNSEGSPRFRIRVPYKFDLDLRTAGGGITLEGIEGEFLGSTGGGTLDLSRLKGSIELTSGGGTIYLGDSELDGYVKTGGGKVLVENVKGDVKATSGGGNVVYRNVETPDQSYPADMVYITSAGGGIDVDDAPKGAELTTGGGDIYVRRAADFVKASTGGGDIVVDELDGWIEATTGAGEINISLIRGIDERRRDIELFTGSGDVNIVLPENFSAEFEIELTHTRNYRGKVAIVSDFNLKTEEGNWERDRHGERRYIWGDGKIGNGDNLVRIKAVNGIVKIAKK